MLEYRWQATVINAEVLRNTDENKNLNDDKST